jgi:hypothetical protein
VLTRILTHRAADPSALLSSWSAARRAKFATVVDRQSRLAYARVVLCVDTQAQVEALLKHDPLVGALRRGVPVVPPSLETKGEELEGW